MDSVYGEGATFHFSVRVSAVPYSQQIKNGRPVSRLVGKRLLIVDDNDTNRFILERQAQSWKMSAETTASGSEALEWLKAGKQFDIAIIDMQMPEIDGLMLSEAIRQLPQGKTLPLIVLTSLGQQTDDPRHNPLAAYLTKPVKPAQLHATLVEALETVETKRQPAAKTAAQSPFDAQMGERHPLRILLAEDNTINQKVALRMLERLGYRADVAANGLEVLEALQRQPYDVVFMDVQMPQMDGVEASQRIRQLWPPEQQPRIIAMTAHALKGDREHYLDMGMDDYISKPVRIPDLIAALNQCLMIGLRANSSVGE